MSKYALVYFCGAGGTSLGAKAAGFETTGIEWDDRIASLYQTNVGKVVIDDVRNINPSELVPVDRDLLVISLSPPCQDYSQANKKADKTSDRANVLYGVFEHIKILKPEYIWLENVPGYAKSVVYDDFKKFLDSLGYSIQESVLNAADFGVPQSRKRLIMIATKHGYTAPVITPTHSKNGDMFTQKWVGWYEAIRDLIPSLPLSKLTDKQKQAIASRKVEDSLVFSAPHKYYAQDCNAPISTLRADKTDIAKAVLIERVGYYDQPKTAEIDDPCWTLRSSLGDDQKGGARTKLIDVIDDADVRSLNVQALARLQSFPDWYQWSGKASVDVKGIGNSVPPLLSQRIFEAISLAGENSKPILALAAGNKPKRRGRGVAKKEPSGYLSYSGDRVFYAFASRTQRFSNGRAKEVKIDVGDCYLSVKSAIGSGKSIYHILKYVVKKVDADKFTFKHGYTVYLGDEL